MDKMRAGFRLAISLVALLAAASPAAVIQFGDGDFSPSGTPCPPRGTNGGSAIAGYTLVKDVRAGPDGYTCYEQRTSGGNPGAYLHVTIEPAGGQITACMFKDDAVYDPALVGSGLAYLDYTEDSMCFDPEAPQCMATGICILQAGNLYVEGVDFVPGTSWTRRARYGIAPTDFSWLSGPMRGFPDFSPTAPPLQFGFVRAKSGGPGTETGLDNWRIVTHDACGSDLACDDGDACTTEHCDAGICKREGLGCDDGNPCTTDQCSAGVCQNTPMVCDDGDSCTTDTCTSGVCQFMPRVDLTVAVGKLDDLLAQLAGSPCGDVELAKKLRKKLRKLSKKARRFLSKADDATKATVVERLVGKADNLLPRARDVLAQAVAAGLIPPECGTFLDDFLADAFSCANG